MMGSNPSNSNVIVLVLVLVLPLVCFGIRSFPARDERFTEAPEYRNGLHCSSNKTIIHVAITLDSEYLRGSIAAIHSVLRHASCPQNVFFHIIAAADSTSRLFILHKTFPSLTFKVYIFRKDTVVNLISSSIRVALENPLNYARNYLGQILDNNVERVIYLDSDVVLVDDIEKLWSITLHDNRVIGAPEYCHTNFTKYFTKNFWSDPFMSMVFSSSNTKTRPCYFNTGVMVMDMVKWRAGNYTQRIERWMEMQREKRIYELGSLPPFLLVFAGNIEPIDHRWNQHGLGGDNVKGSCRKLHSGPVSLLHWSGKGKPWVRLDEGRPCPLDYLWQPYDLYQQHHPFVT